MYKESGLTTKHTCIHINQSILTVSNSKQVYCNVFNWCRCINISCGMAASEQDPKAGCSKDPKASCSSENDRRIQRHVCDISVMGSANSKHAIHNLHR